MTIPADLKWTPLYNIHLGIGAKMTAFAGWEMPVEYSGMKDEHLAVRNGVGLFDISHLGQIEVSGSCALEAIQTAFTNDASGLADGQVQYSLLCNPSGGIIDDVTIYRFNENRYMICVNAVNAEKDLIWLKNSIGDKAAVADRSPGYATLALQGPFAERVLQRICDADLPKIRSYHFASCMLNGTEAVVSRTGYTGEDGFEIYLSAVSAVDIWQAVMETGKDSGIKPCGLGARDSLRLEMGYTLYGNDISETTTPQEAGLDRYVKFQKPAFIGKEAMQRRALEGVKRRLIGFEMVERGVPRTHYPIHAEGRKIGEITSGGSSPSLGKFIGMGYLDTGFSNPGSAIEIEIRNKPVQAVVVTRPFYCRKKR